VNVGQVLLVILAMWKLIKFIYHCVTLKENREPKVDIQAKNKVKVCHNYMQNEVGKSVSK